MTLSRGAVVDREDSAGRVEYLEKAIVFEVRHVIIAAHVLVYPDRGDDVPSVRRDGGHESRAHGSRGLIEERFPGDDVFVSDGHPGLNGADRIQAFIVLWPVEVDAHRFAVCGEGMTVGAGVHVLQHYRAAGFSEIAQPPTDERSGLLRQRFDHAFLRFRRHERHIAIEDGRADRILRCPNRDPALRDSVAESLVAEAGDGYLCRMLHRVFLDLVPNGGLRYPGSAWQPVAASIAAVHWRAIRSADRSRRRATVHLGTARESWASHRQTSPRSAIPALAVRHRATEMWAPRSPVGKRRPPRGSRTSASQAWSRNAQRRRDQRRGGRLPLLSPTACRSPLRLHFPSRPSFTSRTAA